MAMSAGDHKVLRLHGPDDLRLDVEPVPQASPGDAQLRITAIGICGSDLHWLEDASIGDVALAGPLVLGHEFAGVVVEGPRRGQRVAIDPAVPCDSCEYCRTGYPNLCLNLRFAGSAPDDGAMRQFLAWPEKCLFPLPDSLSDEDGAMLEPLGIALHCIELAQIAVGMTVGVYGCGPIGLLIMQVARIAGATTIVATDRLPHRLASARALGAAAAIQTNGDGREIAEVWAATGQRGVDVAFEAAGEDAAVATAVATARPGGTVVLAGIPGDNQTTFSASTARRQGLTFKMVRRMKHTYPTAIQLVEQGLVDVRSLVSHRYSIDKYEEAFAAAQRREGLKVIINP